MDTIREILMFLINVFGSIYFVIVLLRFLLQTVRADFYNPISQFFVKVTKPILHPMRKVIPGLWGIDFACLVLAILVHWAVMQLMIIVAGGQLIFPPLIIAWSIISIALTVGTIYIVCGFVLMIGSFVAPHSGHPILLLVRQLLEPLLRPVQRLIPPIGGMDFSLFFLCIGIGVLKIIISGFAQALSTPMRFLIG